MKKIVMLLVGLMMATLVHAAPLFKEGEHYEVVKARRLPNQKYWGFSPISALTATISSRLWPTSRRVCRRG